ncbi:MAG: putative sugar O-methyltransferase [Woeseiaceae bacterium]
MTKVFEQQGYGLIPQGQLYDWQKTIDFESSHAERPIPDYAKKYLQPTNPRLMELQGRYDAFDLSATTPLIWSKGYVTPDDIQYFRGDNAYVWQLRGKNMNILSYALTTYYAIYIDSMSLYSSLSEDDDFGIFLFTINDRQISRDLIDSIIEIYFLEKHLNISKIKNLNILDIGSGYGRLAHRMVSALPNINSYLCTDGVAVSTFICEFYLKHRGVDDKAVVVPIDEIEFNSDIESVDLAINIHSFSECQLDAIDWWVSTISAKRIKYAFIVPNATIETGNVLATNDGKDFSYIFEKYGYKMIAKEPKYRDPVVQEYGMNPTYHFLFEYST